MLTVGTHVEAKAVSVRTSVDPKATAAERTMTIVPFRLAMFLRYATLVSNKVGIMGTGKKNSRGVFMDFKTPIHVHVLHVHVLHVHVHQVHLHHVYNYDVYGWERLHDLEEEETLPEAQRTHGLTL